jgi:shikimate kinase
MTTSFSNLNAIILIGYMGSGKSTVGRMLAQTHNLLFEDLDDVIAYDAATSIPELFIEKGAKAFRELEHQTLKVVIENAANKVISLGGGAPCYYDNMALVAATTPHVFYLNASHKTLAQRLFPDKNGRPLIAHAETEQALQSFIAKHLFERQPFYRQANHVISVDDKSIKAVVAEIGKLI